MSQSFMKPFLKGTLDYCMGKEAAYIAYKIGHNGHQACSCNIFFKHDFYTDLPEVQLSLLSSITGYSKSQPDNTMEECDVIHLGQ